MARWIWYLIGAVGLAVLYDKYVTPEEKKEWENKIKMHHGEIGVLASLVGILTKSPRLTAVGVGLTAHDWDDRNNWFNNSRSDVIF